MHSGLTQKKLPVPEELESAYRFIGPELAEFEQFMLREISNEHPFVAEVLRYGFRLGGKRLRPALVLLSGKAFASLGTEHFRTAAVIEMIHTATLIHDDILDGAKIRRHLETVNTRWNQTTAVLAGDLLFTHAMKIMTLSDDLFGYRIIAEATRKTCEAELRQLETRSRFELTPDEYFSIVAGKTAALLSCSCRLGAYFSGANSAATNAFAEFGEKLGIAFQIIDDILDLLGEENVAGKTLGTDLREKKPTLPLILHLKSLSHAEREKLLGMLNRESLDDDTVRGIVVKFRESGSIDSARKHANRLVEEGIAILQSAACENASSEVIRRLTEIATFVVSRNS